MKLYAGGILMPAEALNLAAAGPNCPGNGPFWSLSAAFYWDDGGKRWVKQSFCLNHACLSVGRDLIDYTDDTD